MLLLTSCSSAELCVVTLPVRPRATLLMELPFELTCSVSDMSLLGPLYRGIEQ